MIAIDIVGQNIFGGLLKRVSQSFVAKSSLEIICLIVNLHETYLKWHETYEVLYTCFHCFWLPSSMNSHFLFYRMSSFSVHLCISKFRKLQSKHFKTLKSEYLI